ncbi:hypothetical protein Avbf_10482 [Armadillidium vulgare]|nr:hypothetical protein Avbf_10482 [Armadillidium vulgare]
MNLILVSLFIIAISLSCAKHESNRNTIPKKLKPTSTARNASNFKHCPKPKAEKPKIKYSKPKTEGPETNYYPLCVPAANLSRKRDLDTEIIKTASIYHLKRYVSKPYLRKKIVRFFAELKHFMKIADKGDKGKRTYFSDDFEITEEYSDLYELKFKIHLCEIGESLYSSLLPSLPNDTLF